MLTLPEIKQRLEVMNLKAVADRAEVHHNAVYRLMKEGSKPSYETVKRLSDYLEGKK